MGFSPTEIGAMSLWQFTACMDGWNRHHGAKDNAAMTPDDFEAAAAALDEGPSQAV